MQATRCHETSQTLQLQSTSFSSPSLPYVKNYKNLTLTLYYMCTNREKPLGTGASPSLLSSAAVLLDLHVNE